MSSASLSYLNTLIPGYQDDESVIKSTWKSKKSKGKQRVDASSGSSSETVCNSGHLHVHLAKIDELE